MIHTSHQYWEGVNWFEVIFKMFGRAIFEAIEVKGRLRLNFEAATSNFFLASSEKFGCQTQKSRSEIRYKYFDFYQLFCENSTRQCVNVVVRKR